MNPVRRMLHSYVCKVTLRKAAGTPKCAEVTLEGAVVTLKDAEVTLK